MFLSDEGLTLETYLSISAVYTPAFLYKDILNLVQCFNLIYLVQIPKARG